MYICPGQSPEPGANQPIFRLDRRPWTVRHFWQRKDIVREHKTKTEIVVEVIWVVPVAIRAARIVSIVIPRAAAQHPRSLGLSHFMSLISSSLLTNALFQPAFSRRVHID